MKWYCNSWRSFDSCQSTVSLTPRSTICCGSQISHLRKPLSLARPQKQLRRMPGNYRQAKSPKDPHLWATISCHNRRGPHHLPCAIDVVTSSIQPRTAASKRQNVTTAGRRATLRKIVTAKTNEDSHIRGLRLIQHPSQRQLITSWMRHLLKK